MPPRYSAPSVEKAKKVFADIFNLTYDDPLLKQLGGAISYQRIEETSPELFHACRMVREGKGAEHFRTAVKVAQRTGDKRKRQEAVERVVQTYMLAFQREGSCDLCEGALSGLFLRSHRTENYSILLKCSYCEAVHEITSGTKSFLFGEHRR